VVTDIKKMASAKKQQIENMAPAKRQRVEEVIHTLRDPTQILQIVSEEIQKCSAWPLPKDVFQLEKDRAKFVHFFLTYYRCFSSTNVLQVPQRVLRGVQSP
jgi:hypothetical protein